MHSRVLQKYLIAKVVAAITVFPGWVSQVWWIALACRFLFVRWLSVAAAITISPGWVSQVRWIVLACRLLNAQAATSLIEASLRRLCTVGSCSHYRLSRLGFPDLEDCIGLPPPKSGEL